MHITITGASGFVGTNLITYLVNYNETVRPLSLRGDWLRQFNPSTDIIVHLAGKAHDLENVSQEEEYFKVNRDLTIQLFNKFLTSQARDFIYFSSVKAVADKVDSVLYEDVDPNPLTPYGKSKYEAEQYLLAQQLPKGKRLFIIRPCMIHGPGNKGNLNLLYKVVEKGLPWPLASFDNLRSFLSIENLSYLIKAIIDNTEVESGIFNFADDEALSTNSLVSLIAETLNRKPSFWHIPTGLIEAGVKLGDILPLPLNSERLKKLTESYVVSNEKIKRALGIKKLPISVEEGLAITIQSFNQVK